MKSSKLTPRFIEPFDVDQMVNPSAARLKLPSSLKVGPMVDVSVLKPVSESDLVPHSKPCLVFCQ